MSDCAISNEAKNNTFQLMVVTSVIQLLLQFLSPNTTERNRDIARFSSCCRALHTTCIPHTLRLLNNVNKYTKSMQLLVRKLYISEFCFLQQDIFPQLPVLKELIFDRLANMPNMSILPSGLTTLVFSDNYEAPLFPGELPENLLHLIFGYKFDRQIIPGVLPFSLKILKFGKNFNQLLNNNVLPKGLTSLEFGEDFDQVISPGILTDGLTELNLVIISINHLT